MAKNNPSQKQAISWPIWGLWSALATVFGISFWKVFSYGRRLLKQPKLAVRENTLRDVDQSTVRSWAMQIASSNLRAGIEQRRLPDGQKKLVLCAGVRNFREPWARDFGFASFGLLELGEYTVVRESLEVFLLNQKPSGQFPVKIHSTNFLDRYLHSLLGREQPIDAPIRPKYITAHNTVSLDGNALLIIALLNYAQRSDDHKFAKQHWRALKQAVAWLENYAPDHDGLLHQSPFADWADSVARAGRVLYTNVLYWKALNDLADAAAHYGFENDRRTFETKAHHIKDAVNNYFWREDLGYYVTSQLCDNLSSSGNLLAVAWGMSSTRQAHSILDKMEAFKMADPVPTQVVHRAYPSKFIAIENRLGGIGY